MNAHRKNIVWVSRPGLTLLELLLVLAIVGLGFGLAAPSIRSARRDPDDEVQQVLDAARRLAVRRAAAVTLWFEAEGRWLVEGGGERGAGEVLAGTLSRPQALTARVHISPLGACTLDAVRGQATSISMDPVRCQFHGQ